LASNCQTIVNTVNTVGVMGKGLAAAFKERYPEMFDEYKKVCLSGKLKPGSFWLWKGPEQWVLNFSTKKHWRNPAKLEYIRDGLAEFRSSYEGLGVREIAFPRLGCGNGGLNWADVRPLMVDSLGDLPINIYIHDFEKPIGLPEHELPLMKAIEPTNFTSFCNDLDRVIQKSNGQVEAIGFSKLFSVSLLKESFDLVGSRSCSDVIASGDDLYRIWSLLLDMPVTRDDLPETAHQHALKLFSVLAELPYVRPINIADKRGRTQLAVEMVGRSYKQQVYAVN
jgi:O-acetyl-ADP-ribose deacetylase (regulator of RNase III)